MRNNHLMNYLSSSKQTFNIPEDQIVQKAVQWMEKKEWEESVSCIKMIDGPGVPCVIRCSDGAVCHSLLHAACRLQAPLYMIKRIVNICEDQVSEMDSAYQLPLHIAVEYGAPFEVIEFLLKKKISAASQADVRENTPLHSALLGYRKKKRNWEGNFDEYNHYLYNVVKLLRRVAPSTLHEKNQRGMTPFEIASIEGAADDILFLLDTTVTKRRSSSINRSLRSSFSEKSRRSSLSKISLRSSLSEKSLRNSFSEKSRRLSFTNLFSNDV